MDCACSQYKTGGEDECLEKYCWQPAVQQKERKKVKLLKIIGLKIAHFCLRGERRRKENE
jgi:hypothetical protein